MKNNPDLYFVAAKAFLEDKKGNFLIIKDRFGDWDIPGGRLRKNDFGVSLDDVLKRKIIKELGSDLKYFLGAPIVFMQHERNEILPSGEKAKRKIFAVGYRAKYLSGEIKLGENHEKYEWVSVADFNPKDYFTGGWLNGVKEYLRKTNSRN